MYILFFASGDSAATNLVNWVLFSFFYVLKGGSCPPRTLFRYRSHQRDSSVEIKW